jgi:hypothetical protein
LSPAKLISVEKLLTVIHKQRSKALSVIFQRKFDLTNFSLEMPTQICKSFRSDVQTSLFGMGGPVGRMKLQRGPNVLISAFYDAKAEFYFSKTSHPKA